MRDKWLLENVPVPLLMSATPIRRSLPGGEVDFEVRLYTPLAWHGRIPSSQLERAPYLYLGDSVIDGMLNYSGGAPKVAFTPLMHAMLPNCFMHRANRDLAAAHRDLLAGRNTAAAQAAAKSRTALIPPAPGTGRLKLCVFSHGIAGTPDVYWSIISSLASAGYAVAAIEHGDLSGSATMTSQYGVVKYQARKAGLTPYRKGQFDRRVWEYISVLDELEELVRTDPHWRGRLDVERVVGVGHSFGGATACRATTVDRRMIGVCMLDPWMEPLGRDVLDGGLGNKSAFLMLSDAFCKWSANVRLSERFCSHNKNAMFAFCPNSGHMQFTDLSMWAPIVLRLKKQMGSIDHHAFMAHMCRVVVAFARRTFNEGTPQDYDLTTKSSPLMVMCHPNDVVSCLAAGGNPNVALLTPKATNGNGGANPQVSPGRGVDCQRAAPLARTGCACNSSNSDWGHQNSNFYQNRNQMAGSYTQGGRVTPPPQALTYTRGAHRGY